MPKVRLDVVLAELASELPLGGKLALQQQPQQQSFHYWADPFYEEFCF